MISITTKIKKIGSSHFVLIPSIALKTLGKKKGDMISISVDSEINKIFEDSIKKDIFCTSCQNTFSTTLSIDEAQCPKCGKKQETLEYQNLEVLNDSNE